MFISLSDFPRNNIYCPRVNLFFCMDVTNSLIQSQSSASFNAPLYINFITSRYFYCTHHKPQLENIQTAISLRLRFQLYAFALVSRQKFTTHCLAPFSHASTQGESKLTEGSDELSQGGQLRSAPWATMKWALLLICIIHQNKLMTLLHVCPEIEAT